MRKVWLIVKREYVTRVRTKWFLVATIGLPLLTVGMFAFSFIMAARGTGHTLKIAVLDERGGLANLVEQGLKEKLPNGEPAFRVVKTLERPAAGIKAREELRSEVQGGQLDGYLVVPQDLGPKASAEFHTKNPGDLTRIGSLRHAVSDAVVARRLEQRGIFLEDLGRVITGVDVKTIKVGEEGETEEKGQTFLVAIIVASLLYATLIVYGVATMRSVLEEKTTRIIEILVSSVRPFQLLAGKILGVAAVALTQYLIWITTAGVVGAYGVTIASALRPGMAMPDFHFQGALLAYLIVFFLAGYLLYASLFAAVGAMVSSEQEAQQAQTPLTLIIVLSFLLFNVILRNPNSQMSIVLSVIPFFSPILMVLRIAMQTPPFWQIGLALALSGLTTLGVVKLSAKIYRVGILMYGKRPSLIELMRWLRYT